MPSAERLGWISLIVAGSAIPVLLAGVPAPAVSQVPQGAGNVSRTILKTDSPWSRVGRAASRADAWVEGRRRYFETLVLPVAPSGQLPPAGLPHLPAFGGTVGFLTLQPLTAIRAGLAIQVDARFTEDASRIVIPPAEIGPFLTGGTQPLVRIIDRNSGGFLARQNISDWHPVDISDRAAVWAFPDAPWAGDFRVSVSWEPGAFDAPNHEGRNADESVSAAIAASSRVWTLRAESSEPVFAIKRPDEGASARVVEVSGARRALAVLIWSESGRLPRIRARRTDNREWIGVRASGLPLFTAYSDRWSSIWVEIDTDRSHPGSDLRLLAFTDQENPSRRLFVEAIARTLSLLRQESVPIDRAGRVEAARWLRDALGVAWTPQDLADVEIDDPQLAAVLREIGIAKGGQP